MTCARSELGPASAAFQPTALFIEPDCLSYEARMITRTVLITITTGVHALLGEADSI